MKIAVNTRFLLKNRLEGMGRFTFETLQRIVKQHPEHEFYFFFDRPYDEAFIFAENVHPVVLFPPTRHVFLIWWWFEFSVHRALKKIKPDVFVSTDNILSLRTKVPTVLVTHDLAFEHFPEDISPLVRRYYRYFAPKFNRKAKRIVAVSEYTKADLVKTYGIKASKISVACNGCAKAFLPLSDTEQEEVRNKFSEGKEYFFYVGAVHPRKNVHRLIEAFSLHKKQAPSDTKLLIGGRFAWQTGAVSDAVKASAYKEDIDFLGFVSDVDLPRLMGAASTFVYPSKFEGFGIPVLEAMHSEVPIITSKVSSLPEVAGDAAILTDPADAEEIAEAMSLLSKDKEKAKDLVTKGKKQREKFSWQRAATVLWENISILAAE